MKSMRFRTRLLISFWAVIVVALCLPAYYFFQTLEKEITNEAKANSFTQLEFVHWMLENQGPFENNQALDGWCTRFGEQLKYRITIIAAGGRVIADSDVPYKDISSLDNHADRQEVIGARKHGSASSIRYSITVKRKLIYTATNINLPDLPSGILRIAIPLSTIESRLAYFAHQFWLILFIIAIITLGLSYFLSRKLEAPIRKIMDAVTAIGEGRNYQPIEIHSEKEFSRLSTCINDMSKKINRNIEKITRQKQELEAVLEGMQEGVMLLDQDGKIKATNQALTCIAKCVPSCVGHMPMEVFLNPEVQQACNKILQNGEEHLKIEVAMQNKSIYEVNLVRIPEGGAVVVFHDISELVRLEKARRDFVANVSHELRTPLTSIKGYAETLLDEKFRSSDQADAFVNTIVKNANHMSNIVIDLLELTKLQQHKKEPDQLTTVNATACFISAWEICMPISKDKKIRLINELPDVAMVNAEENSLIQVFQNLLDNAIRHSLPETKITVSAQGQKNTIVFGIQDEGPGIPRRFQKRIFERFYRVDKERSRASGGTGLGLAICRHAVRGMGGQIWVQSPPSDNASGSIFYFTLKKADGNP